MRGGRLLLPVLAGATLITLCANALPTCLRKKRLQQETVRLQHELRLERARREHLEAEVAALERDPFYLERVLVETWRTTPKGARRLLAEPEPAEVSPYEE